MEPLSKRNAVPKGIKPEELRNELEQFLGETPRKYTIQEVIERALSVAEQRLSRKRQIEESNLSGMVRRTKPTGPKESGE